MLFKRSPGGWPNQLLSKVSEPIMLPNDIFEFYQESEELENRNSSLQIEITTLQSEIKQLESMLDSHRCSMSCKVSN